MPERIRLAAVQMAWHPDDYATEAAFAARVAALTERAVAGATGPALVAFPELIGVPLLATAGGVADELGGGLIGAMGTWARRSARRLVIAGWQQRVGPLAAAYGLLGPEVFRIVRDAFGAAARASNATIVTGTAFLPTIAFEATRGLHVVDPRPRNVAFVVSPEGALLGRSAKAFLTAGLERRVGLVAGRVDELGVVATPVGRVAVAVCLDGWYHHVLERFDGLAADVVVQPSANDAPWERRWPPDARLSEEDAWLGHGLRAGLQGRAHLRYGVNPMLVGDLRPVAARGRSTIVARPWGADTSTLASRWGTGLLAIAEQPDREEVVAVDVPHPRHLRGVSPGAVGDMRTPW